MKIVAFYLPQFHTFPENDKWWGKGFTEWTNTKKAKPLFRGHYQPHTPYKEHYYDLVEEPDVMVQQAKTAKKYGVDAFCYYHYWFSGGKLLMQKPVERMLQDKKVDIPFCLCWANENWSRRWDGSENSILMAQDYGDKSDWERHFEYLLPFFKDERYLKDNQGKPIFLIYKPQLIDTLPELLTCWRKLAIDAGLPGICLVSQYPQNNSKVLNQFDNWIDFEPSATTSIPGDNFKKAWKISAKYAIEVGFTKLLQLTKIRSYKLYNYGDAIEASVKRPMTDRREWLGAFTGWDNTPRRGSSSIVYKGSTPKLFQKYVELQLKKSIDSGQEGILFINAWNEWAEGAHLEPDEKFGYGYLNALKNARYNIQNKGGRLTNGKE